MQMKRMLLAAAGAALIVIAAGCQNGWQAPPWEVRCYLGPPDPAQVYTDDDSTPSKTWQYNMSKVRGRWVCPYCGYSTETVPDPTNPPTCPSPWMVIGSGAGQHPPGVRLQFVPLKQCFLASTGPLVADPNGNQVHAIIGKPFHPNTSGDPNNPEPGSVVHVAVSGLQDNPNVVEGEDYVRFAFLMPGAKFPAARVSIDSNMNELNLDSNDVGVNPVRVTDGQEFWVQQYVNTFYMQFWWPPPVPMLTVTCVRVYSSQDGLVFYGVYWGAGSSTPGDVRILTADGALRVDVPDASAPAPPPGGNGWSPNPVNRVTHLTVDANVVVVPRGEDTTPDPDFHSVPPLAMVPGAQPQWPQKQNYFVIPSNGRVADWQTPVAATGNPPQHFYVIPQGAVGKGWVVVQWRDATYTDPAAFNRISNPLDNQMRTRNGITWWYERRCEWHYDWLTVSGSSIYTDLWGNCEAAASGTDLRNVHTPTANEDDPPPYIACAFISARPHVPPTGNFWVHGSVSEQLEPDPDPNSPDGHAVVVVGEVSGNNVSGTYEPGTRTVQRSFTLVNRLNEVKICPACGSVNDRNASTCRFCGESLGSVKPRSPWLSAFVDIDVPPEVDMPGDRYSDPLNPKPDYHAAIPDTALEVGPHGGWYYGPRIASMWIGFDLPKYLPPSVPPGANPAVNDLNSDPGYRGRLVVFHRPTSEERTADFTAARVNGYPLDTNWRWDAYYRCAFCGAKHDAPGPCQNGGDQGVKVCPVCGTIFKRTVNTCPFCGENLQNWPRDGTFCGLNHVDEMGISAEEYEPFEVLVSVGRKCEIAAKQAAVTLGRVAPGVPAGEPDTTVGTSSPAKPEPSDVSPAAGVAVMNEGNVSASVQTLGTDLHNAAVSAGELSAGGSAQRSPMTIGTVSAQPLSGTQPLRAVRAEPGAAEGFPALEIVQAGMLGKPVPLGQPAGVHSGLAVFFFDLNGNGALDFFDASQNVVTNTANAAFDPIRDLPLEPVAAADMKVRVAETAFVGNDYFSSDMWPALTFGYTGVGGDANSLLLAFSTNRPPAGTVNAANPPRTGPPPAEPNEPINVDYLSAGLLTDPNDPLYRHYQWRLSGSNLDNPHALTVDATPGTINGAPFLLDSRNLDNNWYAFWHKRRPTQAGVESSVRFNSTASGPSSDFSATNEGWMFTTGLPMMGLRAVVAPTAQGGGNETWLFWHSGARGSQRIYFLRGFDPANPQRGDPLPLDNSFGSQPHRETAPVWLPDGTAVDARKPAAGPFAYAKDPHAWAATEYVPGGGTDLVINVIFSGYVRHEENADICWVKFRAGNLANGPQFAAQRQNNWGKKAFPRLQGRVQIPGTNVWAGEELAADAKRQTFASRHLDWVVRSGPNFDFGRQPDWDAGAGNPVDPRLLLAVSVGGANPGVSVYEITWQHSQSTWLRARNAYVVQPRLRLIAGNDVLAGLAYPGDPMPYRLVDPHTAGQPQPAPLQLEIAPAAGRVRFSAPLMNTEAPDDPGALINTRVLPNALDVQLFADYTPMIWRITRDPDNDDCPWAFWNSNQNGYLIFFWRRWYQVEEGTQGMRSSFMYKLWVPGVRVTKPPIAGNATVYRWNGSGWVDITADCDIYTQSGAIVIRNFRITSTPWRIRVVYTPAGAAGPVTEEYTALGWTLPKQVPVETDVSLGPFAVAAEAYTALGVPVVKFWLAWTSPRALLDLRPPASGGGGLVQSSDVYLATVVPEVNSLIAEPVQASLLTP